MNIVTGRPMRSWMKFALSIFFIFSFNTFAKCEFKSHLTQVFSLSGPITEALKHLKLLDRSKVRGISIFHPVSKDEFHGEIFPGGVFLSHASLQKLSGGLLFYDESQELSRILRPMSSIQSVEIVTRGMLPQDVTLLTIHELRPFLSGCDKELQEFAKLSEDLGKSILSTMKTKLKAVFFLGELRKGKYPEMVIVNDGFVKWLVQEKKLETYPSELSYVNWSSKLMNALPKETLRMGLKDSGRELTKDTQRLSDTEINLIYPGLLIPGITQLKAFNYWYIKHNQ